MSHPKTKLFFLLGIELNVSSQKEGITQDFNFDEIFTNPMVPFVKSIGTFFFASAQIHNSSASQIQKLNIMFLEYQSTTVEKELFLYPPKNYKF